mmetsp:Transcript_35363/g.110541  ORF Transcript_35363/g.110541 Transcript_35363/m.110541 type:complete len:187 (-) Transcript_35363:313-873(-)
MLRMVPDLFIELPNKNSKGSIMKSRTRCADCFQAESLSRASRITLIDCSRHGREAAAKAGLVGLLVGSACCAAAAAKMRTDSSPLFTFFRICLALISICGFCRAFVRVVRPYNQLHYFRFLFAYVVAMTASSAVATLATLIAVVTAIRMCFKTALEYSVGKDPQKWFGQDGQRVRIESSSSSGCCQ